MKHANRKPRLNHVFTQFPNIQQQLQYDAEAIMLYHQLVSQLLVI